MSGLRQGGGRESGDGLAEEGEAEWGCGAGVLGTVDCGRGDHGGGGGEERRARVRG